MPHDFTPGELAILRIAQSNLPDSLTPYADIARAAGVDEAGVIALLTRLKDEGVIRRFGASIKHQQSGWTHNVMVAWRADEALADAAGEIAARHPNISHCYYRPSPAPDWPYSFFTMVHGRSAEECQAVIESLRRASGLDGYAALESLKELKKTSMTYF
ncbi:MAG: Lrp/AsnC family transcriptional regulator [Deltaproteobacteria bacterium]|jgi:DNA-binding Lrp family transcriptional regulator|nr:Lrp/AsnC family transcriptional regulator [Deltaproteobacteria bacterium]